MRAQTSRTSAGPGHPDRRAGDRPGAAAPDLVRLLLLASVSLITLVAFENLAVGTAMPRVAEELDGLRLYAVASGVPLAAQLVGTAVGGGWSDSRGPRGSLVAGIGLFCAGLVVAGLAPTMEALVVGRAVQGFGGGLLLVPLYVLVGSVVPASQQPRFFAAFAAAWVVPGLVGPGAAGLVVEHTSWRWIFLGVPALTLAASALLVPLLRHLGRPPAPPAGDAGARRRTRRLLLAALGAGVAAATLQVAGAEPGAWTLGAAAAAVVVLALCSPVLLPAGTVLLRRGVPAAVACRGLLNATFMSAQTFLPLLLVREHDWSVAAAGLVLTTSSVTWALGSQLQGRVRGPRGRARLAWLGPLILSAGTLMTAGATLPGVPAWAVVVGWTVAGAGMGLVFPALAVLVLQATAPEEHGRVSSSLQISDALGAALGLAGAGALFTALVGSGGTGAYLAGLLLATVLGLLAAAAGARAVSRDRPVP
ncbi:MFS transporter [Georgenia sp. SYP-B2076]|uniref:MFS transporter n=1 Tax=Georgenia sp. SYP-B2076 TaxID=2495881 RepID=UPI00197AA033|nr:MFS transporter [Georgenia sp. SYP-B2076]